MSSTYHPHMDAQTDCINRNEEEMLGSHVSYEKNDWSFLPACEVAMNDPWQKSVKTHPFTYGQHPLNPASVQLSRDLPAA